MKIPRPYPENVLLATSIITILTCGTSLIFPDTAADKLLALLCLSVPLLLINNHFVKKNTRIQDRYEQQAGQ